MSPQTLGRATRLSAVALIYICLAYFGGPGSVAVIAQAHLWVTISEPVQMVPEALAPLESSVIQMSASGYVVGTFSAIFDGDANPQLHAFRWSRNEGFFDLGPIDAASEEWHVSNTGLVVGIQAGNGSDGISQTIRMWSPEEGWTAMYAPTLPVDGTVEDGDLFFAEPAGVNSRGWVAGHMSALRQGYGPGERQLFVWTPDGIIDVGTPGTNATAMGLNESGRMVANAVDAAGTPQAFTWTIDDGLVPLARPFADSTGGVFAHTISETGDIIGRATTADGKDVIVLWKAADYQSPIALPPFGSGGADYATLISGRAKVAGVSLSNGQYHGFYVDLSSSASQPVSLRWPYESGSQVLGINGRGEVVGVKFEDNGRQYPFYWSPNYGFDRFGWEDFEHSVNGITNDGLIVGESTPNLYGPSSLQAVYWTAIRPSVGDTTPPTASIAAPVEGATYQPFEQVLADYTCADAQSLVVACAGSVPAGWPVDTARPLTRSFRVVAVDADANISITAARYFVPDVVGPYVNISSPFYGTVYTEGAPGDALQFTCEDPGGVASCVAVDQDGQTLGNGDPISMTPGLHTITVTASDDSGNASTTWVKYRVGGEWDSTPPVIQQPADIEAEATGPAGAIVTFDLPSAHDDVDGIVAVTCDPGSGTTLALGWTAVSCSATDASDNFANLGFLITVRDTTGPTLTVLTDVVTAEGTTTQGAPVSFLGALSASDAVDPAPSITCSHSSGSVFPYGQTTVSCTATDAHGNQGAAALVTVSVRDTSLPTFGDQGNVLVFGTELHGAPVSYTRFAFDPIDGTLNATCSPASGSVFPYGETVVTCTATDGRGNQGTSEFGVVVLHDTVGPRFAPPPPDIFLDATDVSGAPATFVAVAQDFESGVASVTCDHQSGAIFPHGATVVTCVATDNQQNTTSRSFTVHIAPRRPFLGPDERWQPLTVEATGPNGAVVDFGVLTMHDGYGGQVAATCTPASGSVFGLTPISARVSICSATNSFGGFSGNYALFIWVTDTTAPTLNFVPAFTVEANQFHAALVNLPVTATDLVDGSTAVNCDHPITGPNAVFPVGTTTVSCSSTDGWNNTASATFQVTVVDTEAPLLTVPGSVTVEATGASTLVSFSPAISANDVANIFTTTCTPNTPFDQHTFPIGASTISCTATDAVGNTVTKSFTVTVVDTTAPVVTTTSDITAEAVSAAGAVVSYSAAALDSVDGQLAVTCSPSHSEAHTFPIGVTSVTCSATDATGNTGSASFTVTVRDTVPPSAAIAAPSDGAHFAVGQAVTASFTCGDAASGIASCQGTVANGAAIDTSTAGTFTFTVIALDAAGNMTQAVAKYTVDAMNPSTIAGHMHAEGYVPGGGGAQPDRLRFNFDVLEQPNGVHHLRFSFWTVDASERPRNTNVFDATSIDEIAFSDDPAFAPGNGPREATTDSVTFSGTGEFNDQPGYSFTVTATDQGEPGAARDTFTFTVRDGSGAIAYSASGTLAGGNIQSLRLPNRRIAPFISGGPSAVSEIEADSADGSVFTYPQPTAVDADGAAVDVSCTPESGTTFSLGRTRISCTATDATGRKGTARYRVIVSDNTFPLFDVVPSDITLEATAPNGASAAWSISAIDAVDTAVAINCSKSSGAVFRIGATAVTCTARDNAGNKTSVVFTVTVRDTTAPAFIATPPDIIAEATSTAGRKVTYVKPAATDAADNNVSVACAPTSGSIFAKGTTTVSCTATDNAGNSTETSFDVTVRDTTGPTIKIARPAAAAEYRQGSNVAVTYNCNDSASAVASCTGTLPTGALLDTSVAGTFTFTVDAVDAMGNASHQSVTYSIKPR